MNKKFLFLVLMVSFLFVLGCTKSDDEKALSSITIENVATVTEFETGDTFTFDGLTIRVHHNDGSSAVMEVNSTMISTVDMSTPGTKTVTISYTIDELTRTVTYDIIVTDPPVEDPVLVSIVIESPATKTAFETGETFVFEGLSIRAHFDDESSEVITVITAMISAVDMSTPGTKTVTISYTIDELTRTVTYDIVVEDPTISDDPFVPGYEGTLIFEPFEETTNTFPGFYVQRVYRSTGYGESTYSTVDMFFPYPFMIDAESYVLQYYDNTEGWLDYTDGGEPLTSTSDNFSLRLSQAYTMRLRAVGGEADGMISNTIVTGYTTFETTFGSWGLDESAYISGIMGPFVGRGLEASFTVRTLSGWEVIEDAIVITWYRVNPKTFEETLIEGADELIYITTSEDIGYYLKARADGDGINHGGFAQVYSYWGVLQPVQGFVKDVDEDGFTLCLSYNIDNLDFEILNVFNQDFDDLVVTSIQQLTASTYRIVVDMTDVTELNIYYESSYMVLTEVFDEEFHMHMTGLWVILE